MIIFSGENLLEIMKNETDIIFERVLSSVNNEWVWAKRFKSWEVKNLGFMSWQGEN